MSVAYRTQQGNVQVVAAQDLFDQAAQAFRAELPSLLTGHVGDWVAYHGSVQMFIARDYPTLEQAIRGAAHPFREFLIRQIVPEPQTIQLNW